MTQPAAAHPRHDARVALPPARRATAAGAMLRDGPTVIVDEIHALVRDKRGSHLALSLERLEALTGRPVQRVGLSATQKPLDEVGRFLVGRRAASARSWTPGTFRELDLAIEVPPSPLATVCSHEQWEEIYARMAELVREHRTTLVFVNTRKMAERIAAQLDAAARRGGRHEPPRQPLARAAARRGGAPEGRQAPRARGDGLAGARASTSATWTSSIQVGATRSIATFLQRVGRAGHALRKSPEGAALPADARRARRGGGAPARASARAILDRTPDAAARRSTSSRSRSSRPASREAWDEAGALRPRSGGPGRTGISRARSSTRRRAPHARGGARCCTATA